MSSPQEPEGQAYAPPYGSTPAYGDDRSGGGYGSAPGYGEPAYGEPAPEAAPQDAPPAPGSPATTSPRRGRRALAGLVLACLASGAVGGGVVHALEGDDTTTAVSAGTTTIQRGSASAPAATVPGSSQAAAATIAPSVVTIAVTGTQTGQFGRAQQVSGTGSGIVLSKDGYIVTNNHVVAAAVSGGTVSVTFADGTTVPARIVGTDPTSDLAVVKVERADLVPATFADSEKLAVGQTVLAVGAPLGLSNTVTEGIVSTLHRPVRTGEAGATEQSVIDAVQTDAAINPGNSGGALVDLAGQVVGVNSAIATTGDSTTGGQSGNIGVGFAIPSNDVTEVAQELIRDGRAQHPQIGISVADAPSAEDGTPGRGALVQGVTAGGPAASAGLQQGDIITKVDDRAVTDADSLIVAIRDHQPGDTVQVTVLRGGSTQTVSATLAEAPTR